jgi:iron complex outermembrane receptor protein
VETATEPLFFIPGQSQVGDARSIVYAPYVVDQMKFSDKILVQLGGRFDVLDFDDAATNTSRNDNKFSPMFGVVYSPISDLSLYFNAGQGFAPPSTTVVGERKPEESTQFEGGLKKQFLEGRVMTTLAIYNLERKNIAIPDANGITRQAGDQRSRVFELELMGSPARSWNAAIAYAFNDSELTSFSEIVFTNFPPFFVVADRTGNTPAFAPRNILNAWVTKTFRNGFGIGGGPRYVSDQFIDEDNEFKIDGYVTFDAVTYYDWNHWRFTVNFKNITDKDYETRGFGPFSVIPASPFAVYGSVDFRL